MMLHHSSNTTLVLGEERFYQHLPFEFNTAIITTNSPTTVLPKLTEDWVIQVVHTPTAVVGVKFIEAWRVAGCLTTHSTPALALARHIKQAWHAYTQQGNPQLFEALPIDFTASPTGLTTDIPHPTAFQQAVWQAVAKVPVGSPCTYAQLALAINKPAQAARAIGQALAKNPVPLVVPCHRVSPKAGGLTNFCGSPTFVEIKQFLQAWEHALTQQKLLATV